MGMASELARAQPLPAPRICCLDLDTFFVSVERLLDPTLEGKPVIVGGRPGSRGVVTAASYEVRRLGVKSGMSLTEAGRRAPDAIYLPTRHEVYGTWAERVREVARRFTPRVLVASIDEMYLDFSGCERLYGSGSAAGENGGEGRAGDMAIERAVLELTTAVFDELGLPSSAGVATSKVVAKVASALAKPRGVMLVPAGVERAVLAPLPVRSFPGIGPVAEARLTAAGYQTLGEVAEASVEDLQKIFGAWAASISRGVQGLGSGDLGRERPAFSEHDPEGETVGSISNERTFREDATDPASIEAVLCGLCERVCWRARKRHVKARTVTLKLRYADFHTLTRSHTTTATHSELELYPIVREMFAAARTRPLPIRLLGIQLSNLGMFEQLSLFDRNERVGAVIDSIRARFGFAMVSLATARRGQPGEARGSRPRGGVRPHRS
ncbi:MAG TPA: DNA polymerase IV [Myxococcales bacterium]|nr:DNA polymerase IV [Myxococcales bacterium]